MLKQTVKEFTQIISTTLTGTQVEHSVVFQIEEKARAYAFESIWGAHVVFSYISVKDLIYFFSAVMLERKIVILSKNIHLLTATL